MEFSYALFINSEKELLTKPDEYTLTFSILWAWFCWFDSGITWWQFNIKIPILIRELVSNVWPTSSTNLMRLTTVLWKIFLSSTQLWLWSQLSIVETMNVCFCSIGIIRSSNNFQSCWVFCNCYLYRDKQWRIQRYCKIIGGDH